VLEVGAGAGRFTEVLLDEGAMLVAMDMSDAVHANAENCRTRGRYALLQADINASPLPADFFDLVLCLGVIQHTPSPEQTIANLARHVKPGGWLVIDHYTRTPLQAITQQFTVSRPLRAVLRRVSRRQPALGLRITRRVTAVCDPIQRWTCRSRWTDQIASRLLPSICYYRTYSQLRPDVIYLWNELDTHDSLTDWYKHFRTREQIQTTLERLGLMDITAVYAGNGVEVRARRPHRVSAGQ
jgi:SAM-dependent methyltransferase